MDRFSPLAILSAYTRLPFYLFIYFLEEEGKEGERDMEIERIFRRIFLKRMVETLNAMNFIVKFSFFFFFLDLL